MVYIHVVNKSRNIKTSVSTEYFSRNYYAADRCVYVCETDP